MTPTTRDELIELLANGTDRDGEYLGHDIASDILKALERSGCVVMPVDMTDEMEHHFAMTSYKQMLGASPFWE